MVLNNRRVIFLLLGAVLLLSIPGTAQVDQTGSLRGTVLGPDGSALPGITVVLTSPAIVVKELVTMTNDKGRYHFSALSPGKYELTYILEGMNTLVRRGIVVSVGKSSTVDVSMSLKTVEEKIVVEGKMPTIDRQNTTRATTLDNTFLDAMPAARDLNSYFNMAPGVTSDAAHGSSSIDNSYNLDGVKMTDPTIGLQYVNFGMDAAEEISVQSGGLSAEYGSVKGAAVNVVTKSGGNRFSGSTSFYFQHEKLQADNTKGTPLNVTGSGKKYDVKPAISVGGPILRDKLWFFLNLGFHKYEEYVSGYPYDKANPTPIDNFFPYPYAKFTYQPNTRHKFVLSYNYSDHRSNHLYATRFDNEDTSLKIVSPMHILNGQWTMFFGSNLYVNLRLGLLENQMKRTSKMSGARYNDLITGRGSGTAWRNLDQQDRDRLQVKVDATSFVDDFLGSHELKLGAELQYSHVAWVVRPGRDPINQCSIINKVGEDAVMGMYFDDVSRIDDMLNLFFFAQDSWSLSSRLTLNLGLRFEYQSTSMPPQNQEEGLREFMGIEFNRSITERMRPLKWFDISPRLGLVYDIFENGRTLLKASWSRYVQANIVTWTIYANPNGWFYYGILLNPDGTRIPGAYTFSTIPGKARMGYGNNKFTAPYCNELTLGIEQELWDDWSVGFRYIKKWDRDLIEGADGNSLDIDALMNEGKLIWTNWAAKTTVDPFTGQEVTFYNKVDPSLPPQQYIINAPDGKRDYDGLEITLNKRFARGWSMAASYVYQNSRGFIGTDLNDSQGLSGYYDDPNSHINAFGRFPLERRHQFKLQGVFKGPWGINVSGYYRYFSGERWTRTVTSRFLGVQLNQSDTTIYAEKRGNSRYPALSILDLRVEKVFRIGKFGLTLFADAFNVFNSNKATLYNTDSSNPVLTFGEMAEIHDPRVFQLGFKLDFN